MDVLKEHIFGEALRFMESYNCNNTKAEKCNIYDALTAVVKMESECYYYENVADRLDVQISDARNNVHHTIDRLADELASEYGYDASSVFKTLLKHFPSIVEPLFNERLSYTSLQEHDNYYVILNACNRWLRSQSSELRAQSNLF